MVAIGDETKAILRDFPKTSQMFSRFYQQLPQQKNNKNSFHFLHHSLSNSQQIPNIFKAFTSCSLEASNC
jgi:hypothetical protein